MALAVASSKHSNLYNILGPDGRIKTVFCLSCSLLLEIVGAEHTALGAKLCMVLHIQSHTLSIQEDEKEFGTDGEKTEAKPCELSRNATALKNDNSFHSAVIHILCSPRHLIPSHPAYPTRSIIRPDSQSCKTGSGSARPIVRSRVRRATSPFEVVYPP